MTRFLLTVLVVLTAVSCSKKNDAASETEQQPDVIVFTGATIIDGEGGDPIHDGVIVVRNGRFDIIGSMASTTFPANAETHDVSGRFIVPGIINGHSHVGETKGIEGGHYSKENVLDNLRIYARYGVTTVVSLGGDGPDAEPYRYVNDSSAGDHARLFIAGAIVNGTTPEETAAVVDANAVMGVDIMKIRVDDNLGTSLKMSPENYQAAIARAHERGYKLAAHMYYLDDAQRLVDAGADMLAHSVRDVAVTEPFIKQVISKGVSYCPTLTRELSTFVYESTPEFFTDPFFTREYDSATVAPLKDVKRQRDVQQSKSAATYKKQLAIARRNLKTLSDSGVPIVFGTDSGVPTRFIGYFEHVEMAMMREAGLTPMQIIVSASGHAAEQLGLKGLGAIKSGNRADFLILDANPLADISNLRRISAVYIGGKAVSR